jgi:hypothetical protein
MRPYAKNFMFRKTATYKQRQVRLATEWDLRFDVSDELPVEEIVNNLKNAKNDVMYMACSGVERPDIQPTQGCATKDQISPWNGGKNQYASTGKHVHVCLVLLEPKVRRDVLVMCRGARKHGDEYAAPRNAKFSYAGWIVHHAKPTFKVPGEPPLRFEHGTLPMDPLTVEWAIKIDAILKKWGYDAMRRRFSAYTDLLKKHKTLEKIEGMLMSLEDQDVNEQT